jgi:hypothetical protein
MIVIKMTVFWNVAPCSLVEVIDVSEVLIGLRAHHPHDRGCMQGSLKRLSISTRLYGVTSHIHRREDLKYCLIYHRTIFFFAVHLLLTKALLNRNPIALYVFKETIYISEK